MIFVNPKPNTFREFTIVAMPNKNGVKRFDDIIYLYLDTVHLLCNVICKGSLNIVMLFKIDWSSSKLTLVHQLSLRADNICVVADTSDKKSFLLYDESDISEGQIFYFLQLHGKL